MELAQEAKPGRSTEAKLLLLLLLCLNASSEDVPALSWRKASPIPNPTGVAGAFSGTSGGALLVAGGANFPDRMPWNGGKKVWHDAVYKLTETNSHWTHAGTLPRPLAYGVSISHDQSLICIGGSDADRHYPDAFQIQLKGEQLHFDPLPPLPVPLANMSGTLVSDVIYIAGGTEQPGEQKAGNRLFSLPLKVSPLRWRELDSLPGRPRFLSTAAAHDGSFYLFGGVALEESPDGKPSRVYLRETWAYSPVRGGG